eukprot:Colp12_sorted_trinity150504_noHs@24451
MSFRQLKSLDWLDLKQNPVEFPPQTVVGACMTEQDCKACARKVIAFLDDVAAQQEVVQAKKEKEKAVKQRKAAAREERSREEEEKMKAEEKKKRKEEKRAQHEENMRREAAKARKSKLAGIFAAIFAGLLLVLVAGYICHLQGVVDLEALLDTVTKVLVEREKAQ